MILPEVKKFGVIFTIAILFAVFTFSFVDLLVKSPDYSDVCNNSYINAALDVNCSKITPSVNQSIACNELGGSLEPLYDDTGCAVSFFCNTCYSAYDRLMVDYHRVGFIITSLFGLIAVIITLYASSKSEFIGWIYAGFMTGGILSIFIGTMFYFNDIDRLARPFVILGEIILIIWVTIRTSTRKIK